MTLEFLPKLTLSEIRQMMRVEVLYEPKHNWPCTF
jgi:hypothetical protein